MPGLKSKLTYFLTNPKQEIVAIRLTSIMERPKEVIVIQHNNMTACRTNPVFLDCKQRVVKRKEH